MTGLELQGAYAAGKRDFQGVNLQWASLCKADLRRADLRRADLRWSDLQGAVLQEVNLRGAKIAYKQDDVVGQEITLSSESVEIFSFEKENGRLCYLLKEPSRKIIICGCYINTLAAFEARCKEVYLNDPVQAYEAQISYLKTL